MSEVVKKVVIEVANIRIRIEADEKGGVDAIRCSGAGCPQRPESERSGDRQMLAKLKAFMESDMVYKVYPVDRTKLAWAVIDRDKEILQYLEKLLGPKALEAQDEPEKP